MAKKITGRDIHRALDAMAKEYHETGSRVMAYTMERLAAEFDEDMAGRLAVLLNEKLK